MTVSRPAVVSEEEFLALPESVDRIERGVIQARVDVDETAPQAAHDVQAELAVDEPRLGDPCAAEDAIHGLKR